MAGRRSEGDPFESARARARAEGVIDEPDPEEEGRGGREGRGRVSSGLRRTLASGIRTVLSADDAIRDGLPREVVQYTMRQVDAARDETVRVLGTQFRAFLDNLDIGGELKRILTSVSLEVRTEIRFVPNDRSVKPNARMRVRARSTERDDAEEPENEDPEEGAAREGSGGTRERLGAAFERAIGSILGDRVDFEHDAEDDDAEERADEPSGGRRGGSGADAGSGSGSSQRGERGASASGGRSGASSGSSDGASGGARSGSTRRGGEGGGRGRSGGGER